MLCWICWVTYFNCWFNFRLVGSICVPTASCLRSYPTHSKPIQPNSNPTHTNQTPSNSAKPPPTQSSPIQPDPIQPSPPTKLDPIQSSPNYSIKSNSIESNRPGVSGSVGCRGRRFPLCCFPFQIVVSHNDITASYRSMQIIDSPCVLFRFAL